MDCLGYMTGLWELLSLQPYEYVNTNEMKKSHMEQGTLR